MAELTLRAWSKRQHKGKPIMTEEINYLKIAKKNLGHANKPGSEDIDSAALIAIAAALIAKIEDDRRWREYLMRAGAMNILIEESDID